MLFDFIYWLSEKSGMSTDELCAWSIVLTVSIGIPLVICIAFQIRRPTPADQMMRKHFGGV